MRTVLVLFSVSLLMCVAAAEESDSTKQAERYDQIAYDYYLPGFLDSALVNYERAIAFDSNLSRPWQGKAATLSRLGRYEEARPAYAKAIALRPDYAVAYWHRACDYAILAYKEEALSDLRHALAIDSGYARAALEEEDFRYLWKDPDFLKLVK